MESANGSFLNNQPVSTATLRNGDVIQFGKYSLEVEIEGEESGRAAARRRGAQASEGATVMLSPTEIRHLVAEAKGDTPAPELKLVPGAGRPAPAASAAPAAPQAPGSRVVWVAAVVLGVLAVGLALLLWWITTQ
jgi:pSer/pThr/pTyr-binding forkhead associated (FHA) protein